MKNHDRNEYGTVTIVSDMGVKVLWDNSDFDYWYWKPEELEHG